MNSGEHAYLCGKRTNLIEASAIDTLALIQPVSNYLLLELVYALVYHCDLLGILLVKLCMNSVYNRSKSCLSYVLVVGIECNLYIMTIFSMVPATVRLR